MKKLKNLRKNLRKNDSLLDSFKIALSKNMFLKLLPKKRHFQNCHLRNTFSKLLPQKYIFKSALLKIIF